MKSYLTISILFILCSSFCCTRIQLSISNINENQILVTTNDTIPSQYNLNNLNGTKDTVTGKYNYIVDEEDLIIYRKVCTKTMYLDEYKQTVIEELPINYMKITTSEGKEYEANNKNEIIQLFERFADSRYVGRIEL